MLKNIKKFLQQKVLFYKYSRNNTIGMNVRFSRDAVLEGNSFIGADTTIGMNTRLSKNVKLGEGVRLENVSVGENSIIELGVVCTGRGNGRIKIGKECYIGIRNVLDWSDNITIGNYVHIAGPGTGLWTHSSAKMCLNGIPLSKGGNKEYRPTAPIVIEDNVYIGGNCTIYQGITIHHHSIIVPNSVITKDVPPYAMAGGVPARIIKHLKVEGKFINT